MSPLPYCGTCFSTSEWFWYAKNYSVNWHQEVRIVLPPHPPTLIGKFSQAAPFFLKDSLPWQYISTTAAMFWYVALSPWKAFSRVIWVERYECERSRWAWSGAFSLVVLTTMLDSIAASVFLGNFGWISQILRRVGYAMLHCTGQHIAGSKAKYTIFLNPVFCICLPNSTDWRCDHKTEPLLKNFPSA